MGKLRIRLRIAILWFCYTTYLWYSKLDIWVYKSAMQNQLRNVLYIIVLGKQELPILYFDLVGALAGCCSRTG